LPDISNKKSKYKNLKIIETGKVKPALKRNRGMELAKGELFAFIDDDAYPRKDWLKNAVKYFEDERVGLVGGPNLTPPEANFAEHISGYVLSNFLTSGQAAIRYKITKNQNSKELPSCNYISRDLGIKYDSNFLTAEDSKYCFDVWKKGYQVLYAGDVVVNHHRRNSLWKHIKQMYIYSRDIAWLTKKEFSVDKLYYMIPSFGLLVFVLGLIGIYGDIYTKMILLGFGVYFILMAFGSLKKNLFTSIVVFVVSVATHFAYGAGWLKGMFSKVDNNERVAWNSR
jgi:GT2 family glycosyltransferase